MIFITKCMEISLELYKSTLQMEILRISFSCILIVAIMKLVSISEIKTFRVGNPPLVNSPHIF